MNASEVQAVALELPRDERARLAEVLIASLDESDVITRAWADEAERRYEAMRSGTVQGIPAEEVFAQIRANLR